MRSVHAASMNMATTYPSFSYHFLIFSQNLSVLFLFDNIYFTDHLRIPDQNVFQELSSNQLTFFRRAFEQATDTSLQLRSSRYWIPRLGQLRRSQFSGDFRT
ncbi:hypothetical protein KEM48_006566 [Puccinia striiformis f. sp. tritici PST-130]|nr:hypothetical protein H4Q26_006580 [Puccinia striiformis f. sp. tritici PST-130]KAI9618681.1 hypothetical protein KEM48_006566 [Puccinia striiformis f. sp. tritici PST-130]